MADRSAKAAPSRGFIPEYSNVADKNCLRSYLDIQLWSGKLIIAGISVGAHPRVRPLLRTDCFS